eukprot:4279079-Amphidinium_carterae.1
MRAVTRRLLPITLCIYHAEIVSTHRTLANHPDMEALRLATEEQPSQSFTESASSLLLPREPAEVPAQLNFSIGEICVPIPAYSGETVGCNMGGRACSCQWFHSCFPKHLTLGVEGQTVPMDAGVCEPSMVVQFVLSAALFVLFVAVIVSLRLLLGLCAETDEQTMAIIAARQEDVGEKPDDDVEHDTEDEPAESEQ